MIPVVVEVVTGGFLLCAIWYCVRDSFDQNQQEQQAKEERAA
ncbi:MAG TPA: hypothetical protein VN794_21830 [Methylomirabilota bacterium]|nr:hypothetical protein [Methylomirabilota bacterium]